MLDPARPIAALLTCQLLLPAQSTATVPPVCATLPGNAAVSLPLRWSQGILQIWVDPQLLPANFVGETITGLRLRRSTLPGEVAYGPLQRTLTVRGGFQGFAAASMQGNVTQNRSLATWQVLFGPAPVTVAATPAPGPTTTVGDDFVQIAFTAPLAVGAGTLFLEFEASDGPLQIGTEHWVDAVWFESGVDDGYVVSVGDGSCTTRSEPTTLRRTGAAGPVAGSTVELEVTGAPPTDASQAGFVLAWVGIDPETRPAAGSWLGYGASFGVLDPTMGSCYQWAPFDVAWFGVTDASGRLATSFVVPGNAATGRRLAVQAGWLDDSRPVLPVSLSNGLQIVCNSASVQGRCNSMFFPGTAMTSPWGPFIGQMPVLLLDY